MYRKLDPKNLQSGAIIFRRVQHFLNTLKHSKWTSILNDDLWALTSSIHTRNFRYSQGPYAHRLKCNRMQKEAYLTINVLNRHDIGLSIASHCFCHLSRCSQPWPLKVTAIIAVDNWLRKSVRHYPILVRIPLWCCFHPKNGYTEYKRDKANIESTLEAPSFFRNFASARFGHTTASPLGEIPFTPSAAGITPDAC